MTQKQSSLAEGKSNLNMFLTSPLAPLLLPIRMAGTSVARAKTV